MRDLSISGVFTKDKKNLYALNAFQCSYMGHIKRVEVSELLPLNFFRLYDINHILEISSHISYSKPV
jgi:hypothetical protein